MATSPSLGRKMLYFVILMHAKNYRILIVLLWGQMVAFDNVLEA